mmetsp:Transcript_31896/g.57086  ORF Transcript_31896/g.57086 Transcript_31896/m.57086 type:complete len:81 (+) Transcript_31896:205-447(+)
MGARGAPTPGLRTWPGEGGLGTAPGCWGALLILRAIYACCSLKISRNSVRASTSFCFNSLFLSSIGSGARGGVSGEPSPG